MNHSTRKAVIFGYNSQEPRVIKRVRAFREQGLAVTGACFRRRRFNKSYIPEWDDLDLGVVSDGRYLHRSFALLRAVWKLLWHARHYRDVDFFYAYNLDMAILAWITQRIAGGRPALVYEVGDISPLMVSHGPVGAFARAVERFLLRRTALLVITSPGFARNYFGPIQHYDGPTFLLENKLHPPHVPPRQGLAPRDGQRRDPDRWVIGYFGALRCPRSWQMIQQIAAALPETVEFHLRGYPNVDPGGWEEGLRRHPNIHFGGEYRTPEDLGELYGNVDIVWSFELLHPNHNSRWLLPTRLYEGGYLGVPMIGPAGFEVGDAIERFGIGWTFDEPYADRLIDFFRHLSESEYRKKRDAYEMIPDEQFASAADYESLVATISETRRGSSKGRSHRAENLKGSGKP